MVKIGTLIAAVILVSLVVWYATKSKYLKDALFYSIPANNPRVQPR